MLENDSSAFRARSSAAEGVVDRRHHAHCFYNLSRFSDSLSLIARQNLEHSLVSAADSPDAAVLITRELLGRLARASGCFTDHFGLQFIETGEHERRATVSIFTAG